MFYSRQKFPASDFELHDGREFCRLKRKIQNFKKTYTAKNIFCYVQANLFCKTVSQNDYGIDVWT